MSVATQAILLVATVHINLNYINFPPIETSLGIFSKQKIKNISMAMTVS